MGSIYNCNLVICIGWVLCPSGVASDVASKIDETFHERTGYHTRDLCALVKADRAALAVGDELEFNESEGCDMHDGSKVGDSAIGALTRSRMKTVINPFAAGVALMNLFRVVAKHFSYGTKRMNRLHQLGATLGSGLVANIKLQLDLNGTRISAPHGLLFSLCRLNRALKLYAIHETGCLPDMSDDDWTSMAQFEAVLCACALVTKLSQYEQIYNAAYGPLIKLLAYNELFSSTLSVIDLSAVTSSPRLQRMAVI